MIRRLAIIPARGGSKRIPNKNIRNFCGQPMISYVLRTIELSSLFTTVHVSTESELVSNVASECGFPPDFSRPAVLADDYTPIMPVLRYVVKTYLERGQSFDEVWSLMACSPLIESEDLISAAKMFQQSESKHPLMTVSEFPVPIEWAFSRNEEGYLTPVQSGMLSARSQDLNKHYYDTGSFCVFPTSRILMSEGPGSDLDFIGFILPKGSTVDIDDQQDWNVAEALYQKKLSVNSINNWSP